MRSLPRLPFLGAFCIACCLSTTASAGIILDLTTVNSSGFINFARFDQAGPQSTGTGVINSFAQISPGGNATTSSAYNTTVNNTLDNGAPNNFNHSIFLENVPIVTVDGVMYREFLLDINEDGSASGGQFVSLDEIQLFIGGTANSSVDTFTGGILDHDGMLVYQLDAGMDNSIGLDFQLNSGSGSGDMFFYAPVDLFNGFAANSVVTLYSAFGQLGVNPTGLPAGNYGQSDGFEEWAVRELGQPPGPGPDPVVPEPASLLLFSLGGLGLLGTRLRRRKES